MGNGAHGRRADRGPGRLDRHVLTPRLRLASSLLALALANSSAVATTPAVSPPLTLVVDRVFGRFGVGPGELSAPRGVAIDPKGRILVADTGNHRIVRFDSTGAYLDQFGGFGAEGNRFDRPTDVVAGGTLSIWVLDRGNARVVKFDLEGRPVGVVVDLRSDELRERLGTVDPGGLSADAGGRLLLTDGAEDRIIEFDPLGAVLSTNGGFGPQEGRFSNPSGVAIGARGSAWIADPGNKRVQHLDAAGSFLGSFPLPPGMTGERGLSVAIGPDGQVGVADAATGRYALYGPTGPHGPLLQGAPKDKKDLWASAIAFDASGRFLIADARNHRVVRLAWRPQAP